MKKLQIVFAVVAFLTATVGVFATEYTAVDEYWIDLNDSGTPCDVELTTAPLCDFAQGSICTVTVEDVDHIGKDIYLDPDGGEEDECVPFTYDDGR